MNNIQDNEHYYPPNRIHRNGDRFRSRMTLAASIYTPRERKNPTRSCVGHFHRILGRVPGHRGRRLRRVGPSLRAEGSGEGRCTGAPVRQLNFSSFGTQLVAPGGGVPPPCGPVGPRGSSMPGPPCSPRSPDPFAGRSQEGPTAIDPDLRAPNERDCQRKPTCRTRTCRTRFCVAPPVSPPWSSSVPVAPRA